MTIIQAYLSISPMDIKFLMLFDCKFSCPCYGFNLSVEIARSSLCTYLLDFPVAIVRNHMNDISFAHPKHLLSSTL